MSEKLKVLGVGTLANSATSTVTLYKAASGVTAVVRTMIFHNTHAATARSVKVSFRRGTTAYRLANVDISNGNTLTIEEGWVVEPNDAIEAVPDANGADITYYLCGVEAS